MFRAFYESPWQHPGLLFASAALGLLVALRARAVVHPSVTRAAGALFALQLVDAWLTTTEVPGLGRLTGAAATIVPVTFVILGDLRYLLAAEALRPGGRIVLDVGGVLRALGWSLLVPITSQLVVRALLPSDDPRVLYLTYELLFLALIVGRSGYVASRLADPEVRRWHRGLDRLAVGWYALWSLADALILGLPGEASDVGYLVRVLPNALYYGAMPAVLAAYAPGPSPAASPAAERADDEAFAPAATR